MGWGDLKRRSGAGVGGRGDAQSTASAYKGGRKLERHNFLAVGKACV